MGIELALLAVTAVGTVASIQQQRSAQKSQRAAQSAQKAANAAEAARERRQQIREERVRRARILQSGENTGTAGSSGEMGALGGLSTELASNIATNIGRLQSATLISDLNQQASDQMGRAQTYQQLASLSTNIFASMPGTPAPNTAPIVDKSFKSPT